MQLSQIVKSFPQEEKLTAQPRPYINHSVEFKQNIGSRQRAKILEEAGLNVFFFPSEYISGCDLLSDSGTTSMTNEQWAALHLGDEAYGSNRGYFTLLSAIRETFGEVFALDPGKGSPNSFFFHQGRPCEDALFTILGRLGPGQVIPSNGHFDTTAANIEANNIKAVNLFSDELASGDETFHFKGNINIGQLEKLLKKSHGKIPIIFLTITNNTGGGQPVSLENIRKTYQLSREFGIPLFFDACRFAENAWFIKNYEQGYRKKSLKEIVKEMFSYVDGFTISFKKDGLVNIGGGLFLRSNGLFMKKYPQIPAAILDHQIVKEGHPTYGGMSGRDIMALSVGLSIVTRQDYLDYRIRQVRDFGDKMHSFGIPVVRPIGGHAVYLDVTRFFKDTRFSKNDFAGVSLTAVLLAAFGHRAVELGNFAFGYFDAKAKKEVLPEVNFVRFAIPRLRYEREDLDAVAQAVKVLHQEKDKIPKVKVVYGRNLPLRHFKARFEFV